jgi:hypothetical protein
MKKVIVRDAISKSLVWQTLVPDNHDITSVQIREIQQRYKDLKGIKVTVQVI